MIPFERHVLDNGLRVIVHEDFTTPLVSCNIVYNVGSRDEDPDRTGLAHLLEHYMFSGSKHIPDYDVHLQRIGGINNAYTTQDLTHYYLSVPANNLETALWLESDRMLELAFDEEQLQIQKQVVAEEFKERFLNVPFGDMWLLYNELLFEKCHYRWLPIGKELQHIEQADLTLVRDFYQRYYVPSNAVLVLAGNVHCEKVFPLVEKWFGDIPAGRRNQSLYPQDDPQSGERRLEVEREVPYGMLLKGWKIGGRLTRDFYAYDLISDLFGTGKSSYLYKKFIEEKKLFIDLTTYISGTLDPEIFMLVGRPADGVDIAEADAALSDYLFHFQYDEKLPEELVKVKNKMETTLLEHDIQVSDRASSLAVAEDFSCIEDFQDEKSVYFSVSEEEIMERTRSLLRQETCNTLLYKAQRITNISNFIT